MEPVQDEGAPKSAKYLALMLAAIGFVACGAGSDVSTSQLPASPTVSPGRPADEPTTPSSTTGSRTGYPAVADYELWSQVWTSAIEWGDHFPSLDSMIDNISVAAWGVIGVPEQRVFDDPETDDSFPYIVVPVTVLEPVGGLRSVAPGDTLDVAWWAPFPDELVGQTVLWFLMNARDWDGLDTRPNEDDVYRLSPVAIWVDRGDGVPIAPISEMERKPDGIDLETFVLDDANLPDPLFHRVELETRTMTMESLIAYVLDRSSQSSD